MNILLFKYQGARRTFKKVVSFQVTAGMKMYIYRYTIFPKIKVNKEKMASIYLKKNEPSTFALIIS